ncbi:uncharacterized protein (DUF1778 family) [Limnobacter thiooxidans]|uniref:DUF1778 domain-containing protein n=1 Tax=Limnobacter thiooxidans TaxID=131080 RepID=A0AA86IZJ6_9BURK|nr:uncharacterized protein (DUF1778 family) [Limnobacter thiooxidans]BET26539.1 DUF1778 domain-containing protein [Limnobacter thiooxidans]
MKDTVIKIRTSSQVCDLIDEAAKVQGKTRSDFMLDASIEKSQVVLLDQVFCGLGNTAFIEFVDLIETQFAPSEGFKKLMSIEPIWSKELGKFEH